ncbi:hypothetical protein J6590_039309 [Homalodisca vitripennis]|nr:hypothetical protein J6590_039309 [Homalodisca vitripennis]
MNIVSANRKKRKRVEGQNIVLMEDYFEECTDLSGGSSITSMSISGRREKKQAANSAMWVASQPS